MAMKAKGTRKGMKIAATLSMSMAMPSGDRSMLTMVNRMPIAATM